VTEWQSADERNDRERIDRARQAAEDLFKPKQQIDRADLPISPSNAAPLAEQPPPRRQPRIFAAPAQVPMVGNAETITEAGPERRRAATRRATGDVPSSQAGRIRALTSYGMTRTQVAELYGVTVDEIERLIKHPADSRKPR
jgi:hypothetical protein